MLSGPFASVQAPRTSKPAVWREFIYEIDRIQREENSQLVTGYCVYEKKKNREIKNPKQIKLKNGRFAIKGTCGSCGKPIFRIGKLTK